MANLPSTRNVVKYTLPNGLTVLLEPVHNAPVVSLNVGVRVGSACETDEEAGISHLLEHMVFKGTPSYGAGEIAKTVEASGGELNAYTSFDQTVYYINLAKRFWPKGLNILKEMVFDAIIDPLELSREKEVVIEEIRRGQDNPNSVLGEAIFGLAFKQHTYGRPVIGFEKTVRGFPPEIVKGYYQRWYVPSNMVLGVCGDFDLDEMRQAIDCEFGPKAEGPVPPRTIPVEPLPDRPRFKALARPIQGRYLSLSFPIPSFRHEDTPAIDLLAHVLGDGDTSLLVQHLKERQGLVLSINSGAYTPRDPGLFFIDAVLPKQHVTKVLPAIYEQIAYCKKHGVPIEAINRAKLNFKSALLYEKETCEGTARKWMMFETVAGDFRFEEEYLEAIEQVEESDIRRVAQKYLDTRLASAVFLHPADEEHAMELPKEMIVRKTPVPFSLIEEYEDIRRYRLKNGLTILTRENHRLPLISLRLTSMGGVRFETPANNGISHLATTVIEKGTRTKKFLKIAEIQESIAGSVSASAGRNSWALAASFLSEKTVEGLDLFCDVLLNPSFEKEEFVKEQKRTLEAIHNQQDSLSQVAFQNFQATLYSKHPYRMPVMGTKATVKSLTREAVAKFYLGRMLHAEHSVVAASGDFKADDFVLQLSEYLLELKRAAHKLPRPKPDPLPKTVREKTIYKDKQQAHLVLGFMGPTIKGADRYALEVLNNILAGQGGRLFLELRDKMALAYSVTSMLNQGLEPGYFATYIGCEPAKLKLATDGMLSELKRISNELVSPEELERAKNYIVGNHDLDLQRQNVVTSTLALNELYGFDLEEFGLYSKKILSVTAQEVLAAARHTFNLDACTVVTVKPKG